MDMRYVSPPLPVDLSLGSRSGKVSMDDDQRSITTQLKGLGADSDVINDVVSMFDKKQN
jgi:hypothetical protein